MRTSSHSSAVSAVRIAVSAALMTLSIAARGADDLSSLDLPSLMQMDITLTTAQKRTEDVERVPIAMTVLKADVIGGAKLNSSADLQYAAPGLQTAGGSGFLLPYIRGVGNSVNANGIEPSVAMYVDGVYQSDRAETLIDLADAEQIEILRGPQGTLYGRNATGGAINVTTRGPRDNLDVSAEITRGNLNLRDTKAFFAGPITDGLRASLSAHVRDRDGFYTNIVNGARVDNEGFYSLNGRAQLDLGPTLNAELLLKYASHDENAGFGTQADHNSIPAQLGALVATRPFETASDLSMIPNRSDYTTAALKLKWDMPWAHLQSISAQTEERHRLGTDFDLSNQPLRHIEIHEDARAFTQELQLSPATKSEHLDWLLGAFYMDRTGGVTPYYATITLPGVGLFTRSVFANVATKAYALFGESTLAFNSAFSLTGGLRYNSEEKALENVSVAGNGIPTTSYPDHSHTWNNVTYRLVGKYTLDHSMVYAKTETGFRSGNYNTYNVVEPGPIGPEKVTVYELGVKATLPELPIHLRAAAFFNDYRNLQVQVVDAANGATLLVQAPKAETYGLDTSVDWKAARRLNVGTGLAWLHARYREFTSSGVLVPDPRGGNSTVPNLNLAGKHLSFAPDFTANVFMSYTQPLHTGELVASANYYYSTRVYFDSANAYSEGDYGLVNASLAYRSTAHWNLSLWARNLTNTVHSMAIVPGNLGAYSVYAEPRTYGVTLGYSFSK